MTKLGLISIFESLEREEKTDPLIPPPLTVSSSHTKHHLEDLHPNIAVIRHPDHLPDQKTISANLLATVKDFKLTASAASKLPGEALQAIYGVHEDTVLYWAHHEKLCLIDGHIAFMGGLDLCYGRWDTNQHSIADAHPSDINEIVFPGQDYNNSRVMDFQDVVHWENNKLDRREASRMGWSDIALCIIGPAVSDLKEHFVQRWNFIFEEKYHSRTDERYAKLENTSSIGGYDHNAPATGDAALQAPGEEGGLHGLHKRFKSKIQEFEGQLNQFGEQQHAIDPAATAGSGFSCQILRSCAKWSHGCPLEHSIANAYIEVIKNSQHFVYIENQFFITATSDKQLPIKNKIGAAIAERIIRAAKNGKFSQNKRTPHVRTQNSNARLWVVFEYRVQTAGGAVLSCIRPSKVFSF